MVVHPDDSASALDHVIIDLIGGSTCGESTGSRLGKGGQLGPVHIWRRHWRHLSTVAPAIDHHTATGIDRVAERRYGGLFTATARLTQAPAQDIP